MAISTADAASAAAAGVASVTVSMLGVEPQLLVYAACGAFVGLMYAPPAGRWRAIGVFCAVVLLAAAFGHAAAEYWAMTGAGAPRAMAGVVGLVFHPLLGAAVRAIPAVLEMFAARRAP